MAFLQLFLLSILTHEALGAVAAGTKEILTNSNMILYGYDMMKANPLPTGVSIDPGFINPIFSNVITTNPDQDGVAVTKYELPDGVSAIELTGSCTAQIYTQTVATSEEYNTVLKEFSSSSFHWWFSSHSSSSTFESVHQNTYSADSTYLIQYAKCASYELSLQIGFGGANFTEEFRTYVANLPTEYSPEEYQSFVEQFGTHYISKMDMGSVYGLQKQYLTKKWTAMNETEHQNARSHGWSVFGIGGSSSSSTNHETGSATSSTFQGLSEDIITMGKAPTTDLVTWLGDSATAPVPIEMINLVAIADLLTDFRMSDAWGDIAESRRQVIQANIEKYYDEYCATGITASCVPTANIYNTDDSDAGGWGGSCLCPDGKEYFVGDRNSGCEIMACAGGTMGTCNKSNGKWSYRSVICSGMINEIKYQAPGTGTGGGMCICPDNSAYWASNIVGADTLSNNYGNSKCQMSCINGMQAAQPDTIDGTAAMCSLAENTHRPQMTSVSCNAAYKNVIEEWADSVGQWGGSCTCPDGGMYWVGDNRDNCETLACIGGISGPCNKYTGKWSLRRVTCTTAWGDKPEVAQDPGCQKCPTGLCDTDPSTGECMVYNDPYDSNPFAAALAAAQAAKTYTCYHYQSGQDDAWCQKAGGDIYYTAGNNKDFVGCGYCSCCQEKKEYVCHYYSDGQDDDWCKAQTNGIIFTYGYNPDYPGCSGCSCCRPISEYTCIRYANGQDDDWCTSQGYSLSNGQHDDYPGCGWCECCAKFDGLFTPVTYYGANQNDAWCKTAGASYYYTGGNNVQFPGCGDAHCCFAGHQWTCAEGTDADTCKGLGDNYYVVDDDNGYPGCNGCPCCFFAASALGEVNSLDYYSTPTTFHCKLPQGVPCVYDECVTVNEQTYYKWPAPTTNLSEVQCMQFNIEYSVAEGREVQQKNTQFAVAETKEKEVSKRATYQDELTLPEDITLGAVDDDFFKTAVLFLAFVGALTMFNYLIRCACRKQKTYKEIRSLEEIANEAN